MSGESPLHMMHAERERMQRRPAAAVQRRRRRRLWPVLTPLAVVVLAGGWCGLWYYAASVAQRTLAGWLQREAAAGRVYSCGSQGIFGFPFRIEVRCVEAGATLNRSRPPVAVTAKSIAFAAQVYDPTLLVGEIKGPLTLAAPGQPPSFVATWSLARMTLNGLPRKPESISVRLDQLRLDRGAGANAATVFAVDRAEMQGRIVGGSADDHPVIDAVVQFASASAPTLHPLFVEPLKGDIDAELRGFKDLSPKPWAERFREMHAEGGKIEIKSLRIERAGAVVVGSGTLTVNEHGKLDGELRVAVAGVETIVPLLGVDRLIGRGIDRLSGSGGQSGGAGQGLAALDRVMPGLSGAVRESANAGVIDGLKKLGRPTEIDNKPAIVLPLRFADGSASLGMIPLGEVPPLF